jgi:hypothetical protein
MNSNDIIKLSLRGGITKRSGVIPTKQSHFEKQEIASSNRTPFLLTDHAGRLILLAMTCLIVFFTSSSFAQQGSGMLAPSELTPDSYVKLVLVDSSEFYVTVLAKPLPDRIMVETRYGRLEIPLARISYAIDYRYNWVQKGDLKRDALKNTTDAQNTEVTRFLRKPKLPDISTVATKDHNIFKGRRYLFDDTAHVILATDYGDLYFTYPDLDYVDNWSGQNDHREDFGTAKYYVAQDPQSSQDFLLPTARPFGEGNFFLTDYMVAGAQLNYGPTYWISVNAGGVFIPFVTPSVTALTGGIKLTPYSSDDFNVSAGFQDIYSKVLNTTHIAFPYLAVTYGTWESELTLLGGISYQSGVIDSSGALYYPKNSFIGASGDMRVGENLKVALELYFIQDFGIVPAIFSVRYFQNDLTIDVAVVFSLYKAGASSMETLGQYVFGTPFEVIPLVSGSYHF